MPVWCGVLGWVGWQAPSAVEFRNAANIVDADAVFAAINAFRSDPSSYVPLLQARLDATDERKVLHLPDTLPLMVCVCVRVCVWLCVAVCGCVCVCVCVWLCDCVWWLCMAVCDCGDSVGLGRGILTHAVLPRCACA